MRLLWIGVLALGALALLGLHLRPLLVWRFDVRPRIEAAGALERIERRSERLIPRDESAWPRLVVGNTSLRAPFDPRSLHRCIACDPMCSIPLEGGGLLSVIRGKPPADFESALLEFAPAPQDLSVLRSPAANWSTLEGIATIGLLPTLWLERIDFETPSVRGILTRVEGSGPAPEALGAPVERFIFYCYARSGEPGRVIGISRSGPELARRIAATLQVGGPEEPARCEAPGR